MTDSSTATDLVDRARVYATEAHQRINHRRKYNNEPYHVHLSAVAKIVASVTDDPNVIAAAWLHDTVEDTQATLEDIESSFGVTVAELVADLERLRIQFLYPDGATPTFELVAPFDAPPPLSERESQAPSARVSDPERFDHPDWMEASLKASQPPAG